MIKAIQSFFDALNSGQPEQLALDQSLSIAALLIEVASSDGEFDQQELTALRHLLEKQFHCMAEDVDALIHRARASHQESICLYRYTSIVKQASIETRQQVIAGLWQIAYADGQLDPHEEASIRKVADLLYVSHSDFVKTKLQAQGQCR